MMQYRHDDPVRPHIPVLSGPDGVVVTRDLGGPVPEDSADHPHHRGVWWGHRDVNGADVWTEFPGHGSIRSAAAPVSDTVGGVEVLVHEQDWVDAAGRPLLRDRRVLRRHPEVGAGSRALDIESTLVAAWGPVVLGDTKEAGLVALRVAPVMEERRGGSIVLSTGASGESESWGRGASWCDYSGVVDGVAVGVAVMDHPANPRPARWHVRDYGLLAANPFGLRDFTADPSADGSLRLDPAESVRFRYRILTHRGGAETVQDHYDRYTTSE